MLRWLVLMVGFAQAPVALGGDAGAAPRATSAEVAPRADALAGSGPALLEPDGVSSALPPELAAEELSVGATLLRTMVVLGIVVALIYLLLNVGLRKLLGIRSPLGGRSMVSVLERVPLDQKHSLFVVRAVGEVLLVGASEGSLELITKLDASAVEKHAAGTGAPAVIVSPLVQKLLGRKDARPPAPT